MEDQEGWPVRMLSALRGGWDWWIGLSEAYAWQEIGAFLIPALLVVAVVMFWGIRRMHLGD